MQHKRQRPPARLARRSEAVQSGSKNVVTAIETITGMISEISQVTTAISAAVEQQSAATADISMQAQSASVTTKEIGDQIKVVEQEVNQSSDATIVLSVTGDEVAQSVAKLKAQMQTFMERLRTG